jgi:hypothetical protein
MKSRQTAITTQAIASIFRNGLFWLIFKLLLFVCGFVTVAGIS